MQSTRTYQVRVFKIGVDPNTPSDGTQPTMPDKEQLRLEALRAAKESWLQALRAAGLASRARQDAALAQASRQALLEDLRCAGKAMSLRQLRLALAASERRQAEYDARVAALLDQAAAGAQGACGCRGGALRGGCRAAAKCAGGQAY